MTGPEPGTTAGDPTDAGVAGRMAGEHRRVLSWIYGLIVTAAVLASASSKERGWVVAAYVFATSLVYWAAESYAHLLATRTVTGSRVTMGEFRDTLRDGWVLVSASYLPLLVVIVGTAAGVDVSETILVALMVTVVLLFVAGWRASRASGLRGPRLVLSASIAGSFGIAMILFKFFIH